MRRYTGSPVHDPCCHLELPDREVPWFDLRLALAVNDTNVEMRESTRMDANVINLAGTVKEAMAALANVPAAASRLKNVAVRVSSRVDQVDELTNELEAADAMLATVVGQATAAPSTGNGGPPLDSSPSVTPPSPGPFSGSPPADPVVVAGAPPAEPTTGTPQPAPTTAEAAARIVEAANAQ